jgi:outer membrane receptor protein involved in Fe transport
MKRFILVGIVLSLFTINVFSQPSQGNVSNFDKSALPKIGTIRGKLIEAGSNVALEYANVGVYNQRDSSVAGGALADNTGLFVISDLAPGLYYIDAKFIGYNHFQKSNIRIGKEKSDINLGTIELTPSSENLNEVKVYSQERSIVYQLDKKIIDPSQIATAANGTAVDVLANTPSVSVDIEGNVSLRGSSNFTVLIDGRPTPFTAADALQQIPASTIRNIEIITNPSAKFDPDGNSGIININTKKSKASGVSGIVNATADSYGSLTGDFLLNYKTGKFNFFVGGNKANRYGEGQGESLNKSWLTDAITGITDTITTTSKGLNERGHDSWSVKTGVDYYINDNNTLTFSTNLNGRERVSGGTNNFTESSTSGRLLNTLTKSNNNGNGKNISFNLDYKKKFEKEGHELTAFLYYETGNDVELSYFDQFKNDTILFKGQKNWENGDESEIRFKADYVYPITLKIKIEAGYQARLEKETGWNDVHWYTVADDYVPSDTSAYYNNSDFKQNIHSIYATWSNAGTKFGYQLGLRTEYTDWIISYTGAPNDFIINRWDFFPTLHLSLNLTDKQQFTTSYTRRIQRPRGYFFEPFKTWTDAYNVRQGNPGIQPEYIDSYEFGYQLQLTKGFVSTEVYHRKTNDKIEQIRSVYSENVMLQTFDNIGKDYSTGVEMMLNYKPAKWWSFNLMGNLYQYRIVGNLNGRDVDNSSTNWNARLSNTFNITKTTKLQVDGMYNSPTTSAQGSRDGFAFTNVAVRQDFFNNKLNATFSVRDVLNTAKFGFESKGTNFYSKSKFDMKSPVFSITLSYKINNFKQKKQAGDSENGGNGEMNGMDAGGGNE